MNIEVEFSQYIEKKAFEKHLTKMDMILEFCADNFIDPMEVVPLISQSLKDKIEIELQEEGKLPKFSTAIIV